MCACKSEWFLHVLKRYDCSLCVYCIVAVLIRRMHTRVYTFNPNQTPRSASGQCIHYMHYTLFALSCTGSHSYLY